MSVGSVLLQPERVARATVATDDGVVADVAGLLRLVADEVRAGGPLAEDVEASFEALGVRLLEHAGAGLERATDRLEGLLSPVLSALDRHVGGLGAAEGPDEVALAVIAVVDDLAGVLSELGPGLAAGIVGTAVTLVQEDLGLDPEVVRTELSALADDLVTRLDRPRPGSDEALRRRAATLSRLVRRWSGRIAQLPAPELDTAGLTRDLADRLRTVDARVIGHRLQCIADALHDAVTDGSALVGVVATASFGGGTVGAAAAAATSDRHLWYLSWLLGGRVEVDVAGDRIVQRNVFGSDEVLATSTDVATVIPLSGAATVEQLERFGLDTPYRFTPDDLDRLEAVAHVSAIVGHALESLLHLVSIEEGDVASNALQAFNTAVLATADGLQGQPFPWWVDVLVMRVVTTLIGSLEGMHTRASAVNRFATWVLLVLPDAGEVYLTRALVDVLRDLLLSVMTLATHQQPTTSGAVVPSNRLVTAGVVAPFVSGFGIVNRLLVPKRSFGFSHLTDAAVLGPWLLGAPIFGIFGSVLGHLVAKWIAGARDLDALPGHLWRTVLKELAMFVPSWYLGADGDTGNGHYNPNGADFPGYPDAASSPYRLPWAAGDTVYVFQGNQGFFSHFRDSGEVYAYDFSLDQGVEVLAMRDGTVFSSRDGTTDDDSSGTANRIIIEHGAPIPGHDRGASATTRTWASYLHGRQFSVRGAFGGSLPAAGTPVSRGQVIMLAGDTGNSFHNHVHVQVHPDDGTGSPDLDVTLPFVFREVSRRHELRDLFGLMANPAGVATRINFYTSENS